MPPREMNWASTFTGTLQGARCVRTFTMLTSRRDDRYATWDCHAALAIFMRARKVWMLPLAVATVRIWPSGDHPTLAQRSPDRESSSGFTSSKPRPQSRIFTPESPQHADSLMTGEYARSTSWRWWKRPENISSPISCICVEMITSHPSEKPSMMWPSSNQRCLMILPYLAWKASSRGFSGSSRSYSKSEDPRLMDKCVSLLSRTALRVPFCVAKRISRGGCFMSRCSSVFPSWSLIVNVQSSEPKASLPEVDHAPHTMRFGCLPRMGIFLRLLLL
mmetsp:Transcript_12828/g.37245  ORF Transcript_12828/g.37245 Transcript_12828/m.37245 type:complete len:276 (-) Transcript_12828:249-1076(-)